MISIFRLLVPASVLTLFLSEILLIFGSYGLGAYLDPESGSDFLWDQFGWQRISLVVVFIVLGMYIRQLYGDLQLRSRILLLQQLVLVMGMTFICEALISFWNLGWALPRTVLISGSLLTIASLFVWRTLFSLAIRNKVGLRRVLFMGMSPASVQLAQHLGRHPEVGFALVGYLDSHDVAAAPSDLARLGSASGLQTAVDEYRPDLVVIGQQSEVAVDQADDFAELHFGGVQTQNAAWFYEKTLGRVCAAQIRPETLLFSDSMQPDRLNLRLQSMYTYGLTILLLPVLIPLTALVAIFVRATSRGGMLIREQRVGLRGVPFTMYWFRLDQHGIEPLRAPRIARLLRLVGFHALPQLWNVLRGDMLFTGPQADRLEFAQILNQSVPFYTQRTAVRPGMTGWAQINHLKDDSWDDTLRRLEYDLYYIKNLSFVLDLFVLLRWFRENFLFREA